MADIEWIEVEKFKPIGAVGFIGNDIVAILAYYDDKDGNQDGKVSIGEKVASFLFPIKLDGQHVTEVAMQARVEMNIAMRDPSIYQISGSMFTSFASGLVIQGAYAAYFGRGVSVLGKGIAKQVTSGMVKEFVVRKGFEAAVKEAFMTTAGM
ncbi:MAG: hypothetical protein ABJL99_12380 [Aliishimia sp.]